jgi:hypothetical protein
LLRYFPPCQSFNTNLNLLMQPSCRFLRNYWAQVLGLFTSPLGAPTSFPPDFSWGGGVGLIFTKVIMLVAYLGSWALVAPIIATKLFLNYHLFLLEMIGLKKISSFPF